MFTAVGVPHGGFEPPRGNSIYRTLGAPRGGAGSGGQELTLFVPDKAHDHEEDISPAAGRLFRYYCKWRDHESRLSRKGFKRAVEDLKLTRTTAYRAQKDLLDLHWIELTPDDRVMPVFGSFKPVDKLCDDHWREWQERGFRGQQKPCPKNETGAITCPNVETDSPKKETKIPKNGTETPKNGIGSPNDRARASSISSSPSSSTLPAAHTPDLESQPARARDGADEKRGCAVCKIEFTLEQLQRYARNESPPLGTGWMNNALEGCKGHVLFGEWLKRDCNPVQSPAAQTPLDARQCPDCEGSGWCEPGGKGKGMAKCRHPRLFHAGDASPPMQAAARSP